MVPDRLRASDLIDDALAPPPDPEGTLECRSPADTRTVIGALAWSTSQVGRAVLAARRALPAWRRASQQERFGLLTRYAERLSAHRGDIEHAIVRSVGKPLWEARTELDAMINKVAVTLSAGQSLIEDRSIAGAVPARIRHRPLGVCAVIGPFNFPGHLPNGHIVPALAAGNTVVFKPSEKTPEVAIWMAQCLLEAGLPAGVFQLVQGPAEVARALVEHGDLDAIMFTGSTDVGRDILTRSARWPGRLLALEMGGCNAALVLDDAALDGAATEIAFSSFVTAGQRCTATRNVIVQRGVADALLERLAHIARDIDVGDPLRGGADPFMGPVISAPILSRTLETLEASVRAGTLTAVTPVARADVPHGHYLRPAVLRVTDARETHGMPEVCRGELFAPVLMVHVVDSLEDALERANATRFGLAASVFTRDEARFEIAARELEVGVCNWNRGTVGSLSSLPFGGVKDSGNHRAAGLYSPLYCVDPVAEIRLSQPPAPQEWPGFPRASSPD